MNAVALVVAGVLAFAAPPADRGYHGVQAVDAPIAVAPAGPPAPAEPAVASVRPVDPPRSTSMPPRLDPTLPSTGLDPRRTAVQRAGVAMIVLGAAGYVAMIVGLGLGAAARSDLAPLRARDEIDRRRAILARGELANRLALGAGVSAGIVFALGVTLVAVARRRGGGRRSIALRGDR